jgi:hypothetical protein
MRADLLALTPESLTLLSNVGLVKRAQKELAAGTGPTIDEAADGTVTATSRDGATTRLPRDTPLKAASCTCGSSTVCRHRIAAVLAYQAKHAAAVPTAAWDPGALTDDAIAAICGADAIERARKALRASFVVTTKPGSVPVAALPASTVHFLAPGDLAFAKCDCTKGHACEHVVLAVWAFRRCPDGGVVELGTPDDERSAGALARVDATLRAIVTRGFSDGTIADELRVARAGADSAGLVWIADALEDLERQKDAYERQSALFSTRHCALVVAELAARLRAASRSDQLPPRWILGSDEPRETQIEQVRLIALGARLVADEDRRLAEVYFAEPDSKSVLVLRRSWTFAAPETPKNGHDLTAMYASSKMALGALARGELITRAARRRANGEIDLSAARGMKTSLLPASTAWDELPAAILVRDLASHEAAERQRPPALLRPRKIGDRVRVVAIARVHDVIERTAEQELLGHVEDAAGARLIVRVQHRTVSPGAVDAARDALARAPRFVSGELRRTTRGWEVEPLAIVGERVIVPDLEKPRAVAPARGGVPAALDALGSVVHELGDLVDRGVHKGWPSVQPFVIPTALRLREAGMARIATLLASSASERLLDVAILRALADELAS